MPKAAWLVGRKKKRDVLSCRRAKALTIKAIVKNCACKKGGKAFELSMTQKKHGNTRKGLSYNERGRQMLSGEKGNRAALLEGALSLQQKKAR